MCVVSEIRYLLNVAMPIDWAYGNILRTLRNPNRFQQQLRKILNKRRAFPKKKNV
ncbi:hypothetical protein PSCICJ_04790 [Pseudomonas cichorii]|nr:hypothetical protein PSCICJ_04790 [Pseudomonas cichorii]